MRGLQLTIAGVLSLWDTYGGRVLQFMLTRRLNQDACENLFSVIRSRNGQNDLPDASKFRMALRKTVATNILAPPTANCEPDGDTLLTVVTSVSRRVRCNLTQVKVSLANSEPVDVSLAPIDATMSNILTYVGGWVLRRGAEKHACVQCSAVLAKPDPLVCFEREMMCGLKSFTGASEVDAGSLVKPTQGFYEIVSYAYRATQVLWPALFTKSGMLSVILNRVMTSQPALDLLALLCDKNALVFMITLFIRLNLYRLCKQGSSGRAPAQKQNRKLLKVTSRA